MSQKLLSEKLKGLLADKSVAIVTAETVALEKPSEATLDGKPAGPRRFRMLANTGGQFPRYWGRLVIDLAGVKREKLTAALLEHNDSDRVGVIDGHSLDAKGLWLEGHMLSNEKAAALVADADEGFPFKCSVGVRFSVTEEVAAGAECTVNAKTFTGPLTVAKASHLFECSFISANPADLATTAELLGAQKEINTMADVTPEVEKEIRARLNADVRAEEISRTKAIAAAFPGEPTFASEQIASGASLVEAKAAYSDVLAEKIAKRDAADEARKAAKPKAGKVTTLDRLKAEARHPGVGFTPGAEPDAPASDRFAGMDHDERAKAEVRAFPEIVKLMAKDSAGAVDPIKAYARALRYEAMLRDDGRPFLREDTIAATVAFMTEHCDPRWGPLNLVGDGGERLAGTWGRSGFDMSRVTTKGFLGSFYGAFEEEMGGIWAKRLGFMSESNQEIETHRWLGFAPQFRQWVGNRTEKGLPIYEIQVRNELFESTVPVDKNDFKFQKFGLISMRLAEMGKIAAQHWNKLVTTLITANGTAYDAASFFSASHTLGGSSGTMSNLLTVSDYAQLNVSNPTNPSPQEMGDAILAVSQQFSQFLGNNGEPLLGDGARYLVMVPFNLAASAFAAIRMLRLDAGASNPLQVQNATFDVVVNPRLSATASAVFYVFREDGSARKPFILQEPSAPELLVLGPGSSEEFLRHRFIYGAEATRAAGLGAWEMALKATLS